MLRAFRSGQVVLGVVSVRCGVPARIGALRYVVGAVVLEAVLLPDQRFVTCQIAVGVIAVRLREFLAVQLYAVVIAVVARVVEI